MKKELLFSAILCVLFAACNETDAPEQKNDLISHGHGILYGTLATDEPYTVSLFNLGSSSDFENPTVCDEGGVNYCQSEFGSQWTCITEEGNEECFEKCSSEGKTRSACSDVGYSFVAFNQVCTDYDGTLVWTLDESSTPLFCNNKCNAAGTNCDASGSSPYVLCDEDEMDECYDYYGYDSCVLSLEDSYCTTTCTQEGKTRKNCESTSWGGTLYTEKCTKVGTTLVYVVENEAECVNECNTSGTGCDSAGIEKSLSNKEAVSGSSFCTGTLIHPQWVLTAAHCVSGDESENKDLLIGVGNKETALEPFEIAGTQYIYPHEGYDDYSDGDDIALIKLKSPIDAKIAEPVLPLPKWLAFNSKDLPANMETSGFGYDENGDSGTKTTMSLPTTAYCGAFNPSDSTNGCYVGEVKIKGCHPVPFYCSMYGEANETRSITIPYGTIYAPIAEGGQCNGDSGGPTYYTVGGKRYVVGVTSYGDAQCRGFNVATSVMDYYDWIIGIAPEIATQYKEICGNGLDDDNNGYTDDKDPACKNCGNGVLNDGEQCDGSKYQDNKTTCAQWNSSQYSSGNVSCNSDCTINYSKCTKADFCGNGIIDSGESCDQMKFEGDKKTCAQWDSKYTSGNVSCKKDCTIDYSSCVAGSSECGDGVVNGDEVCDGTKFLNNRYACKTLFPDLYSGGQVTCTNSCTYDTTACVAYCGNGSVNGTKGEACDHSANGDKFPTSSNTCEKVVGAGSTGTLKCAENCLSIDTSGCSKLDSCGNGKIDSGEECDGSVFPNNKTACADLDASYIKGEVTCNANCTINYKLCQEAPSAGTCGNNKIDDGELCDGTKFSGNKKSCNTLFPDLYEKGSVTCTNTCEYDTSSCVSWCGNGSVNGKVGEVCDHSAEGDKFPTSSNSCEKLVGAGSTGTLMCSTDCKTIITSGCTALEAPCGNGVLNDGEQCDQTSFADNKTACADWNSQYIGGNVLCNKDCTIDFGMCETAGGTPLEICNNKADDDDNGLTDCDDPACLSDEGCKSSPENPENPNPPQDPENPNPPQDPENPNPPQDPENPNPPQDPENPNPQQDPENPNPQQDPENPNPQQDPENPNPQQDPENPNPTQNPENPEQAKSKTSSGSDCSSTPLTPAGTPMALLLGILGLGAIARRRRED